MSFEPCANGAGPARLGLIRDMLASCVASAAACAPVLKCAADEMSYHVRALSVYCICALEYVFCLYSKTSKTYHLNPGDTPRSTWRGGIVEFLLGLQ